jgi:DNA-directed RNA polymerase III subunit RPC1
MYRSLSPPVGGGGHAQVVDNPPVRVGALDFGVMPEEEIQQQAQIQISDRNIYNLDSHRTPTAHGPLDLRLGTSSKAGRCETCFNEQRKCNGHWGYIRLEAACYHVGYLAFTLEILNQVCKTCSKILLPEPQRQQYLKSLRKPDIDSFQKRAIIRKVQFDCKKARACPHGGASNGPVRRVAGHACKLVHLKFEFFHRSTAKKKIPPPDKVLFDFALESFGKANPENTRYIKRAADDLPAIKVHRLFCKIPTEDCELLGLNSEAGRPESYLWTYLPVPPANIRPSVPGDQGSTEDDLTTKLSEIIDLNARLRQAIDKDEHMSIQMDYYEKLQDHIAMYINSHAPGLNKTEYGKAIRSFCSRLKGKQGRFRGNLSGKRVNYSGRTVISPDPNLSLEEVGIPIHVAKILSYPETVTEHNKKWLRAMIRRGAEKWPGVNAIRRKYNNPSHISMKYAQNLNTIAKELEVGDVVHRHLVDGDIVLFNRQPSLHKLSILCHQVRIHQGRTFRFNESVCLPYNADFDGDEMNIHVPQTEEARAEALELMGVKHNLVTPKNGAPIIAPTQDFLTAAYLLSNKDRFFTRHQFSQIIGFMFDANVFRDPDTGEYQSYEIPPPSVRKPMMLWTGKQIFNVLMRPSRKCKVLVNVEAPLREFRSIPNRPPEMSPTDSYLVVRNSEIMCGVMDKKALGEDGKKTSIFYVMLRDFGEDYAVQGMNRMAKLAARWLTQQGFSIGVGDVYPSKALEETKKELLSAAYSKTQEFIEQLSSGQLTRLPGCTEEQTLESKISKILSDVRNDAGQACFKELSRHNAAVIMAKCGAKGSMINVSQMTAGVGQQMIAQKRVENGFQERTLPHFPKGARDPSSKGFVSNSFFSGLTPTEFIFHAMSGREGLVDTAVKTAETGYMSRRLIKSLEDAYVVYDNTIRNSGGNIIQFSFGDDFLDPARLEGNRQPVHFERTFSHAVETTRAATEPSLTPEQIREHTKAILDVQGQKLVRHTISERVTGKSEKGVGTHESIQRFIDGIQNFLGKKADRIAMLRALARKDKTVTAKKRGRGARGSAKNNLDAESARIVADNILQITLPCLSRFIGFCIEKYLKAVAQPGHAVGAIAAQSIGEPGTQMTLNTFHFAGVAGMSITQGVPRIKEIINAAKKISTPVITCALENSKSDVAAKIVKARIEKTYLRDIAELIEDSYSEYKGSVRLRINMTRVNELELELRMPDIVRAILSTKGLKLSNQDVTCRHNSIRISPDEPKIDEDEENELEKAAITAHPGSDDEAVSKARAKRRKKSSSYFYRLQDLKRNVLNVVVKGHPDTNRAIIRKKDPPSNATAPEVSPSYELLVEGYGLKACMTTEGVDGARTTTNAVMETVNVLGIEAARSVIIAEIQAVMETMDIDTHHIYLLACIMTHKGEVLGITRFGMVKMGDSVLQLASFEKTPDHLFDAATRMKSDPIAGVSESIIMGQTVKLGTGVTSVVRPLGLGQLSAKVPLFQSAWDGKKVGGARVRDVPTWKEFGGQDDVTMAEA